MAVSFLGKGWGFPIIVSKSGGHKQSADDEKIKESCRIILGTALGERAMRPDFGCIVHELLFESADSSLCGKVEFYVKNTLDQWEPRIKVHKVQAVFNETKLIVTIDYIIRRTNRQDNLVYIFTINKEGL